MIFGQSLSFSLSWWLTHRSAKMDASARDSEKWPDSGVSFRPFANSSGWWWLFNSLFLIRISCHKTTHANGYYGAWPGWAVSISLLPLTALLTKWTWVWVDSGSWSWDREAWHAVVHGVTKSWT